MPERSILRPFVQKRPSPKKRARREAVCFHKPLERFHGSALGTPPCTVCFELSRYRNIRWHGSRDTYASCRPKISGGRGGAGCQPELSFRQMEISGSLCRLVSVLGCSRHRATPSRDYHTTRASFTRRLVKSRAPFSPCIREGNSSAPQPFVKYRYLRNVEVQRWYKIR